MISNNEIFDLYMYMYVQLAYLQSLQVCIFSGCEFGDAIDCSSLTSGGQCYAGNNAQLCCGTCKQYETGIAGICQGIQFCIFNEQYKKSIRVAHAIIKLRRIQTSNITP